MIVLGVVNRIYRYAVWGLGRPGNHPVSSMLPPSVRSRGVEAPAHLRRRPSSSRRSRQPTSRSACPRLAALPAPGVRASRADVGRDPPRRRRRRGGRIRAAGRPAWAATSDEDRWIGADGPDLAEARPDACPLQAGVSFRAARQLRVRNAHRWSPAPAERMPRAEARSG